MLWRDSVNPMFCPILHLEIYFYFIKAKGGHFFPTVKELHAPPANGIYKTWMRYETFLNSVKNLCETLFAREGPWGTHTCRKTSYLLAICGGGTFESIMMSARHSDINSAKKYERDAMYLLESSKINGISMASCISKWKPIYVENLQLGRSINEKSARHFKPLYYLAKDFLEGVCQVDPLSVNFSIPYVLDLALAYKKGRTSAEKLTDWISSNCIPGTCLDNFHILLEDYSQGVVLKALHNDEVKSDLTSSSSKFHRRVSKEDPITQETNEVEEVVVVKKQPRKRKFGENDLVERHLLKDLKTGTSTFILILFSRT